LIKSKCWIIWAVIEEISQSSISIETFPDMWTLSFFTGREKKKGFSLKTIYLKSSIIFNRNKIHGFFDSKKCALNRYTNAVLQCKLDKNANVCLIFSCWVLWGFFIFLRSLDSLFPSDPIQHKGISHWNRRLSLPFCCSSDPSLQQVETGKI
jgi:hypothetical protein